MREQAALHAIGLPFPRNVERFALVLHAAGDEM